MKKTCLAIALVMITTVLPGNTAQNAMAAAGQWSQASGSTVPSYDEFNRSDDTNGTVCATTYAGTPYVCWSEYRGPEYKLCVSKFDGSNWVPPSGNTVPYPNFDLLDDTGNYSNPSMVILTFDDGTGIEEIPIIFANKSEGVDNYVSCSYLKNGIWVQQYFKNYYYRNDKPHVTIGDDGWIYATWCKEYTYSTYMPVVIRAEPNFPLVWKHLDGSVVGLYPNTIFFNNSVYNNSCIAVFDGKPMIACSYKQNAWSGMDIGVLRWDGANWVGLSGTGITVLGDSTHDDRFPRIAVNSNGSPVLCWQTSLVHETVFFAFWNGAAWVNPESNGYLNISTRFAGNLGTLNPDLAKGQLGMFHLAFNDANNLIYYLQTDLSNWYAAGGQFGLTILNTNILKPSLAVQKNNLPMIAGDRLINDNPCFTMYWADPVIFAEWGIEINPPGPNGQLGYDDDGKVVPALPDQDFKLRAIINIPPTYGWTDVTLVYSIPSRAKFVPEIGLNVNMYGETKRYVMHRNSNVWEDVGLFPMLPGYWDDVTKIKITVNTNYHKLVLRFGIKYNGLGQAGSWLVNSAEITVAKGVQGVGTINRAEKLMAVLPQEIYYSETNIVSNPVERKSDPTFYLDASPYSGTISTDGAKVAEFTIYIIPVGYFFEEVYLNLEYDSKAHLQYNFDPPMVPRGYGIRKSKLYVTGTNLTPPGVINVTVKGLTPSMLNAGINNSKPGFKSVSAQAADTAPSVNLTLNVVGARLALAKRADRISVQPGSYITYTITVQNVGGAAANDVILEDALPEDVDYISSNPTASVSGKKAVWTIGQINEKQMLYFTIRVKVKDKLFGSGTQICNVAVAYYNGWLTSAATVYVSVRPTDVPCPTPQAQIKFDLDEQGPVAGKEITGKLYIWDGCNPYSFQMFWGDGSPEIKGTLEKEGYYNIPPHAYDSAGTYLIICYVTDKYGKQNVIRKNIVVH